MGNPRCRAALFITSLLDHFSKKRKECCMTHLFFFYINTFWFAQNSSNTPNSESPIYSHSGDLQDLKILLLIGNVRHASTEPQFLKTVTAYKMKLLHLKMVLVSSLKASIQTLNKLHQVKLPKMNDRLL